MSGMSTTRGLYAISAESFPPDHQAAFLFVFLFVYVFVFFLALYGSMGFGGVTLGIFQEVWASSHAMAASSKASHSTLGAFDIRGYLYHAVFLANEPFDESGASSGLSQ